MPKILPIVTMPHQVLREVAKPVAQFDDALQTLIDDMFATMYAAPGIGLAAPQVGVALRLAVIDVKGGRDSEAGEPLVLINPTITQISEDETLLEEGCLSLPHITGGVWRPEIVTVQYTDRHGVAQTLQADGLLAKCIQHEIDHLNGVLFWDHMSALKRGLLQRRYSKKQKQNG